jgi:hypothetical protein
MAPLYVSRAGNIRLTYIHTLLTRKLYCSAVLTSTQLLVWVSLQVLANAEYAGALPWGNWQSADVFKQPSGQLVAVIKVGKPGFQNTPPGDNSDPSEIFNSAGVGYREFWIAQAGFQSGLMHFPPIFLLPSLLSLSVAASTGGSVVLMIAWIRCRLQLQVPKLRCKPPKIQFCWFWHTSRS